MSRFLRDLTAVSLLVAAGALFAPSQAQEAAKPRTPAALESEIARYCGAIAPSAGEARMNYQFKRLTELETRIKEQLEALEKRESETREWVIKRNEMMKAASEDVVAIYAKMSAESAAAQLEAIDDQIAASVLSKLKPQTASSILGNMDAEKAAHLTSLMAAGPSLEKKS